MRDDDGDVAQIQCRRRYAEYGNDCLIASDCNQVETAAEKNYQPYGVDWSIGERIYLAPEPDIIVNEGFFSFEVSTFRFNNRFTTVRRQCQDLEPIENLIRLIILRTYLDAGNASSRANANAILALANMAEQPVKNCTRMTKNHIIVPPVVPPAFKKICATGSPVGLFMIALKSVKQKQNVTVSIHPTTPDTSTAARIAVGPRRAASCVSSDML